MKILLVEDDQLLLRMYQQAFEGEGFTVATAPDGKEGLAEAERFMPDLIMMDIMMPNMNGLDVLDKLKGNPKTKNIPVIMLTNLAGTQDEAEAKGRGAVDYFVKSHYKPRDVVLRIKQMLGAK